MSVPDHQSTPAVRRRPCRPTCATGKVATPALHRVCPHQRLFARLDDAGRSRAIWVHAGPGAGKTTLVASWLAARKREPLWYRLDGGDRDPATLFAHLAAARPSLSLPLLTPEMRASPSAFARRFFRGFFAGAAETIVVLDDYHEVGDDAPLDACLRAGLEEVPEGALVVVISRGAPPASFARLRLNGLLEVIEPEALRVRPDEAAGLAGARGLSPSPDALAAIVRDTQGWTAGVILMLETGRCGLAEAPTGALPQVLFDYFAAEIFEAMPEESRRTLCILAMLPATTRAAAASLTGRPEAAALLEDLRRRNYFTSRDGAADPVFRFHPLFREFLLQTGRTLLGTDDTDAFRRHAAALLEAAGQPEAAVPLLTEAGAQAELAGLIRRGAETLLAAGRNDTLLAWLAAVDDTMSDPWLAYWAGAARVHREPAAALPFLERAFALFDRTDDGDGLHLAWLGKMEAVRLDAFGDFTRYDALLDRLPELLARHPVVPKGAALAPMSVAIALFRRGADRDAIAFWRARALRQAPDDGTRMLMRFMFGIGDLHDAQFTAAQLELDALPDPFTLDDHPLAQVSGLIMHALAMLYRQKDGDCIAFIEDALVRVETAGFPAWLPVLAGMAGNEARRKGDVPTQRAWLKRMAAYADRISPHRSSHYHLNAAQLALTSGDMGLALKQADRTIALASGWSYYEVLGRVVRIEALLERSDFAEAEAELDRLDAALARSMSGAMAFPAALLRADLALGTGDAQGALDRLRAALRFGRAHDHRRSFVGAPRCAPLYALALRHGIEPDFVRILIRHADMASPDPHDERWPWPIRIRTLGGLAIEVEGAPLAFPRKTPRRLLTLVKAIAAHGGRMVPETWLIDAVWPDEEADAAMNALGIAVHRLRKLLGATQAIVVANGTVGFEAKRCWLDVAALEHLLGQPSADDAIRGRLLALYEGDFLAGDDLPWAAAARERWRRRVSGRTGRQMETGPNGRAPSRRLLDASAEA